MHYAPELRFQALSVPGMVLQKQIYRVNMHLHAGLNGGHILHPYKLRVPVIRLTLPSAKVDPPYFPLLRIGRKIQHRVERHPLRRR